MRAVSPGDVWMADLGLAAKVRPALQQVQSVSISRLERRLGILTPEEMNRVLDALADRLGV